MVVLRVLQVGMSISESTVAGYLCGYLCSNLRIHGLGEMMSISAIITLIALEEVIQARWSSSCLLLLQGSFPLSLQLLVVLYIVSCLLSHIHQLKRLPIGIFEYQTVLWVNSLHAGRHSLGILTRLCVCF